MNRFLFEILAKTEITQHFKKRMVPRGVADIFQIFVLATRTNTTLRGRGTGIATLVAAQKDIFELHHASIGKQQGGVVAGHQRT